MHRGWEISDYHDVQDIGSSIVVVWVSGWGVRPKDKTRVPISIVTQEFPPPLAQPRVPVDMLGVQVSGHQDRQPASKASVQVRSEMTCTWKAASFYPELSWSACSALGQLA